MIRTCHPGAVCLVVACIGGACGRGDSADRATAADTAGRDGQRPRRARPSDVFSAEPYRDLIDEALARARAAAPETLVTIPGADTPRAGAVLEPVTKFDLLEGRFDAAGLRRMALPRDASYTIRDYAAEVERELGRFESFNPLEAGQIIPITVDGIEVIAGAHTAGMSCDRPVWLGLGPGGQCVPYARLGRLRGSNSATVWTFIARRYTIRSNPDDPVFEDVAIVGYHRPTGRTAFFQMLDRAGKNAIRVPSPMEPALETPPGSIDAEDFWLSPARTASIRCNICHDTDPFIHSPYAEQVKITNASGTFLAVPSAPLARYDFVGTQAFTSWEKPRHFKPVGNQCVLCHRMGPQPGTETFIQWATGVRHRNITDQFGTYPLSHWMPPEESGELPESGWDAKFRASVTQIRQCIADPGQPACRLTPVP